MQAVLEQLQESIQHALALGLSRAGGLEPLRDALRAIQPYESLAPLAESLQRVLEASDPRAQMNELARLYYACEQCLVRLHVDSLPALSAELRHEPTRQTAAPPLAEPFAALFRGDVSLIEALPALYEIVDAWQPGAPILPLQLTLAHSGTAHLAIEKLQSLGQDALPVLIRLAGSKSPMTRLRACELLLDYTEPKATAALRGALPKAPRALPLFQKLRQRPDLHNLFVAPDAPPLEQWLEALHDQQQLRLMLQRTEAQIMLLPPDAPVLRALLEKIRQLVRREVDYWYMVARIPHEQITRLLLLSEDWFVTLVFEHFMTTLDYRLTPPILGTKARFWDNELNQLTRLGDAAFLPHVLLAEHNSLRRYGEPAEIVKPN
ncbi:MAG: hypothetical protein NZM28_05730 [Fimbriimonadales bacterium]|nr:hypothetical protein [Fimbriimonadales bacterium]